MKHLKMLGLLAVAAAALLAFVGTASATTLTSPTGTTTTPTIHLSSVGHAITHSPIGTIECNLTVAFKVETHGAGTTADGKVSTLDFINCTGTRTFTSVKGGEMIIHWTSGYNGTLTSTGLEVQFYDHSFGGTCIYTTNGTNLGAFTGGSPAKLDLSATIARTGGTLGAFCGSTASWTGTLQSTSAIYVDP